LRNNGDGSFTNVAVAMGISGEFIGDYFGIGWGDYNNDGAIDLFAAGHIDKYRLFRNDNCPGNYLNVNLIGTVSTYNAVGAMAMLWTGGESITRWVHGGEGKHDFSSFNLEFGLGEKTLVDSLVIYWPGGIIQKEYNIAANQFLNITEGSSPLNLNILTPDTTICPNTSIQIFVEVNGGTGNYNYLWSPPDGLSDPTLPNPIATPDETTTYTCTVDDGNTTASDNITISLFTDVEVHITATPNDTVCINETIVLDAGAGFVSYLWPDGSTQQFYQATNNSGPAGGLQEYWVNVVNINGCTGSDTIWVYFDPCTGVDKKNVIPSFEIFPNPAKDKISILLRNFTGDVGVQILTIDGNEVYDCSLKQIQNNYKRDIDLSFLPKGMYLIRLISPDGKFSGIRKFVKLKTN